MRPLFPDWLAPMGATLTKERFTGPEWTFERKYDGIRLIAFKRGADVQLYSRGALPNRHSGSERHGHAQPQFTQLSAERRLLLRFARAQARNSRMIAVPVQMAATAPYAIDFGFCFCIIRPMAKVELTRHLYQFFPKLEGKELTVEAATVADVVREMERIAPGFAFYVCDELGRLRRHVNIFVEDVGIGDRQRLSDPVAPTSRVFIMQALSGG